LPGSALLVRSAVGISRARTRSMDCWVWRFRHLKGTPSVVPQLVCGPARLDPNSGTQMMPRPCLLLSWRATFTPPALLRLLVIPAGPACSIHNLRPVPSSFPWTMGVCFVNTVNHTKTPLHEFPSSKNSNTFEICQD